MSLLDSDTLVMTQVTSFASNDFAIEDAAGAVVGEVQTQGSLGSRMFLGSRELAIVDASGAYVCTLTDPPDFGRDRFEVSDQRGVLAEIIKEFSLVGLRLSIEVADGGWLEARGSFFEFDFTIDGPHGGVATVSRTWPGVAAGLLGRSRFVVAFTPGTPAETRKIVIGLVIAIDLIRAKRDKAASSAST